MNHIGQYVKVTRMLTHEGIVDCDHTGIIVGIDNGIITVAERSWKYITGPDSIEAATPINENTGRRVKVTGPRGGVRDVNIGREGVIVGWHDADRPYVVLSDGEAYEDRHNGSWIVTDWEYVEDITPGPEPITFETKDRMIGKRIRVINACNIARHVGVEGVVTGVFHVQEPGANKVDGITVKIAECGNDWVQQYEVLPAEDIGTAAEWKARAEQAETRLASLTEFQRKAYADWSNFNVALNEKAAEKGLCGDYERIMEQVSTVLTVFEFEPREQEYEIEVTITGTMTTTTTVTVTATSEEDAWDVFNEDQSSYIDPDDVLTAAARSQSFDDIEVETA
jgi:hypothetical protein